MTFHQTLIALRETCSIAVDTLRAHKLRTFLTLLGVMLAVTTLVAVMSILNGLNLYVANKVANLGSNAFVLDRIGIVTNLEEWNKARKHPPLTTDDLDALRAGHEVRRAHRRTAADDRRRSLRQLAQRGRGDSRRDSRIRRDPQHGRRQRAPAEPD
jgi:hypothetical protein